MPDDAPARPTYHHGDLRAALLRAAEAELTVAGVEGFSLRQVAKRAGVSHAAPAHHFGDVQGLLTALCAEGFTRLLAAQMAREAAADPAPRAQLLAAGLGYIDFARANTALFRLMFSSLKPDHADHDLADAGHRAYGHLVGQVAAAGGLPDLGGKISADVAAVWAAAHGLAGLLDTAAMQSLAALPQADLDGVLIGILARNLPR
jgi:AcrR family transcriptional regulator